MNEVSKEWRRGRWIARLEIRRHYSQLVWVFPGPDRRYNTHVALTPFDRVDSLVRDLQSAFAAYQRLASAVPESTTVTVEREYRGEHWALPYRTGPSRGVEFCWGSDGMARSVVGPTDLEHVTGILQEVMQHEPELRALLDLDA